MTSLSTDTGATARRVTAALLVVYGILVFLQAASGGGAPGEAPARELVWAGLHLAVALVLAAGVVRGGRWSWWGSLVLVAAGLFFLLPVAMGILLGGGGQASRSGLELVLLLATFVSLLVVAGLLVARRGAFGGRR